MEVKKFSIARELVESMNAIDKRIWISADDPVNHILKVIDEHLEYTFEITLADFKKTGDQLSTEELESFKSTGNRWDLVSGVEISEQQKFLLSGPYLTGMANYLADKYQTLIEKSPLRVNSTLKELSMSEIGILPVDPGKRAYHFNIGDKDIVEVKGNNMFVPLFDINLFYSKEYKNIFDVDVEDFVNRDDILLLENEYYEKIVEKLGTQVEIFFRILTPLTVLPCSDWGNKRMGFSVFEQIGIGIFKS